MKGEYGMEFYFVTEYTIEKCLEFMEHENIYDVFLYEWKKKDDKFILTFNEYKNSILSLKNSPKPKFEVMFENLEEMTGIKVIFLKGILQPVPYIYTKDIVMFWEKKLNANLVS